MTMLYSFINSEMLGEAFCYKWNANVRMMRRQAGPVFAAQASSELAALLQQPKSEGIASYSANPTSSNLQVGKHICEARNRTGQAF